jgi:hypothetical protein
MEKERAGMAYQADWLAEALKLFSTDLQRH